MSVVALLREEGRGLVAEGVEIPVPHPPRLEPKVPTVARMWQEPSANDIGGAEREEELLLLNDEEDY